MKLYKIFILLFSIMLAAGGIAFFVLSLYFPITYNAPAFHESSGFFDNPYCGFYHAYQYTLTDKKEDDAEKWSSNIVTEDDNQLVLLQINLSNFKTKPLSDTALTQLDNMLSIFSQSEKQMIIRFLYDWDGEGKTLEPDSVGQICEHMLQTGNIVNQYKEHIFILQGNFTGSYGEMSDTGYDSPNDMSQLVQQLASVTESGIFLAVRTPAQFRFVTQSFDALTEETAYSDDISGRLSLFNDQMLSSDTDNGTYGNASLGETNDFTAKANRDEELAFQNQLCQFVPNGGAVSGDSIYSDLANAVSDLSLMHISYLDMDNDEKVLNKWKNSTYSGDGIYNGLSGYDYIRTHLGYRYVMKSSKIQFHSFLESDAVLSFEFENAGFAPAYCRFRPQIILISQSGQKSYTYEPDIDTRKILAGDTCSLKTLLPVRDYEKNTYNIYFSLYDEQLERQILFANDNMNTENGIFLGTLTIN